MDPGWAATCLDLRVLTARLSTISRPLWRCCRACGEVEVWHWRSFGGRSHKSMGSQQWDPSAAYGSSHLWTDMEIALQCVIKSCHVIYALLPICLGFFSIVFPCLSPQSLFKAANIVSAFFTLNSLEARQDNVISKILSNNLCRCIWKVSVTIAG